LMDAGNPPGAKFGKSYTSLSFYPYQVLTQFACIRGRRFQ